MHIQIGLLKCFHLLRKEGLYRSDQANILGQEQYMKILEFDEAK